MEHRELNPGPEISWPECLSASELRHQANLEWYEEAPLASNILEFLEYQMTAYSPP